MTPLTTVEFAEDYFNTRLHVESWEDAESSEKLKALCEATRAINMLPFEGRRSVAGQENAFPRGTDTLVPATIQYACCEEALQYLEGRDPELERQALTLSSQGYSNIRSTTMGYRACIVHGILSERAWLLLRPYMLDTNVIQIERSG
jgi:hypothetical protein